MFGREGQGVWLRETHALRLCGFLHIESGLHEFTYFGHETKNDVFVVDGFFAQDLVEAYEYHRGAGVSHTRHFTVKGFLPDPKACTFFDDEFGDVF